MVAWPGVVSTSSFSLRRRRLGKEFCVSWPLGVWGQMRQARDQGLRDTALPLLSCLCSSEDTSGLWFSNSRFGTSFASAPSRSGALVPQDEGNRAPQETRSARVRMAV